MAELWPWIEARWFWIDLGAQLLAIVSVPSVILQRRGRPMAALSWILCLLSFPALGLFLWWLIGRNHLARPRRRRHLTAATMNDQLEDLRGSLGLESEASSSSLAPPRAGELLSAVPLQLADTVFPATDDNEVVAIDSHDAFDIMERDILAAEDHIHALFYIWRDDQTGRRFRDVLIESARRGVRVRVLSDAFGSPAFSTRFVRPLKRAGVAVERFLPPRIFSPSPRINFRNHRKILVIDGHIGFIGGFNVGDEYRTQWRDLGVRMRGPAVDQLQEIFAEDWYYASDENLADKRYFGCWTRADDHANAHRVASIASGPDAESAPIEDALFAAINMARQRIRLVTPYFVPTRSLLTALRSARYRGVTVEVMVPSKSDVRIVRYASRSYYPELLESGVRIYEYQPSMLHAKFATFDDELVLVGSANIDNRSFRLNFEASCVVAGPELNQTLNHVFDEDKLECKRIEPADLARLGPVQQLVDATANLLSPLL